QNRKGLVPVGGAPKPLWVGSMFHKVVDQQSMGIRLQAALKNTLRIEFDRYAEDYTTAVGVGPGQEEIERFWEAAGEAVEVVEAYYRHYGVDQPLGQDFEYIATEVTAEVAIPHTRNYLILTM